jgi:hypothetical protein
MGNSDELNELQVDDGRKDTIVVNEDMVESVWWYSVVAVDLAGGYWWACGIVGGSSRVGGRRWLGLSSCLRWGLLGLWCSV